MIAPKKTRTADWLNVMRQAHRLGMSTTATMMYGHVETLAERVEHMRRIRELQDETRGFRAFISWTFQPDGNRLAPLVRRESCPTSFDYLLTQAVCRIYLDNVDHIQSSWVTQGMKVGQVALGFGADDLGSVMIEENVVSAAGHDASRLDRRLRPRDQGARQDPGAARHAVPRRSRLELGRALRSTTEGGRTAPSAGGRRWSARVPRRVVGGLSSSLLSLAVAFGGGAPARIDRDAIGSR